MAKGAKKGGGAKGASKKTEQKKREKVVEDKTFGLKNKNKSKKVQKYVQQVQKTAGGGAKGGATHEQALAAKKKAEKEAQKQAEKEMLELFGDAYALSGKKKPNSKLVKKAAEEDKKKEEEIEAQKKLDDERDFGVPICALREVFGLGARAMVERICVEMVWKDNLAGKAYDGSACHYVRVNDGTTLNPMTMCFMGETPQSTSFLKVNTILDVKQVEAVVRGDKVILEVPKGAKGLSQEDPSIECSVSVASERLSNYIKERIVEEEEIRERGGIPIEERIEEERANLKPPLTPVTKERFFAWKEKNKKEKEEAEKKAIEATKKGGKVGNVLSGRALFQYDASLFVDDEGAVDSTYLAHRNEDFADEKVDSNDGEDGDDDDEKNASNIQESLYLEGDDDLDDLDDEEDDE